MTDDPVIVSPPFYAGPTPPALLDWLAREARAAARAASSSPVYADAWWGAPHAALGRSPREEAATGWAGCDRVVRLVNRLLMGGP